MAISASSESVDYGGHDLNFTEPPDDLVCMICHLVAREAQQVECCGKVFCRSCIEKVRTRLGSCPNCRKLAPKIFVDLRSERHIKQLKLSCENESAGCSWTGTMEAYDTHRKNCDFVEVSCPNWCMEKVLRRFLDEHLQKTCPQRLEVCVVCHKKVPHEEVPSHHETCPSVEVRCTNYGCSVKVYRGQLVAHQNVCPKHIISCPYLEAGCTARILREDLQTHLTKSIHLHSVNAKDTVTALKSELRNVQKMYNNVCEKLQSSRVPPVTFKVCGYHKLKSDKKHWRSPFFFSHQGGYKMQLHVNPNGSSEGFLSAFLYIASGPNDDELVWPFNGTVTVQLLNQHQNGKHHSKDVRWNNAAESASMKPTEGIINVSGLGFRQFISHTELESEDIVDRKYIKNDSLYVCVSRVDVSSTCKPWLICTP